MVTSKILKTSLHNSSIYESSEKREYFQLLHVKQFYSNIPLYILNISIGRSVPSFSQQNHMK